MGTVLARLRADRRGVAALEFAIVAPVLLGLLLGGIDFGRMIYLRQELEYATEAAARYYMVNNGSKTQSDVTGYLTGLVPVMIRADVTVSYADTVNCNANSAVTCTTITATYAYSHTGYLPFAPTMLRATAEAVRY